MTDIVIFGATGFTGVRIALYLARFIKSSQKQITFALAGRSWSKLQEVRQQIAKEVDEKIAEQVSIVIADVADASSLLAMATSARVCISAVGPYRFYGKQVVAACVEAKTDYVDVTGEPEFIEKMIVEFSDKATDAKTLIVHACGFDSIPADLGAQYAASLFPPGSCHNINSYVTVEATDGLRGHYGTWQSAVEGFGSVAALKQVRKSLAAKYLERVPYSGTKPSESMIQRVSSLPLPQGRRFALPFPGSDSSVVRNSQRALFYQGQRQPYPYYSAYFTVSTPFWLFVVLVVGTIFRILASFKWGRKLLCMFPRVFSLGAFSHAGPTETQMRGTSFRFDMFASGTDASGQSVSRHVLVTGPEPGYVATPILVVQSALCILEERDRLPVGGVFTPGAVFTVGRSTLLDRLNQNQISFRTIN